MIITKDSETQKYIIDSMEKPKSQGEYNRQHNAIGAAMNLSPYQMLIEQIVTGDRGFLHPVFGIDGQYALNAAQEQLHWRDVNGYVPELPRKGVSRRDYVISEDAVSNADYIKAITQPLDPSRPLNPSIGWENQAEKDALEDIVLEGKGRTEKATGNWSDLIPIEREQK